MINKLNYTRLGDELLSNAESFSNADDPGPVPGLMNKFGDSGLNEVRVGIGMGGVKLLSGETSNRTRDFSASNSGLLIQISKDLFQMLF